jgi:hypothetical protein
VLHFCFPAHPAPLRGQHLSHGDFRSVYLARKCVSAPYPVPWRHNGGRTRTVPDVYEFGRAPNGANIACIKYCTRIWGKHPRTRKIETKAETAHIRSVHRVMIHRSLWKLWKNLTAASDKPLVALQLYQTELLVQLESWATLRLSRHTQANNWTLWPCSWHYCFVSGSPGFISRPEDRLYGLKFFVFFRLSLHIPVCYMAYTTFKTTWFDLPCNIVPLQRGKGK